ncbi:MAG: PorV/PorQ family protein [Gemmatimonadaceae bacterium]
MRLTRPSEGVKRRVALLALLALVIAPSIATAQANSGALDLLFPIGARATGMGTAFVAEQGSESVWWNPAGLSRLTKPEFALDHFENILIKGDAASFILPVKPIGVFALSARIFDAGVGEGVDSTNTPTSAFINRTFVLGASFAADFGSTFDAGVTYHLFRGQVGNEPAFGTSAVDIGIQYRPIANKPLRIGLEVRNLGLSLQVRDQPQADELPMRVHLGVSYDPVFAELPKEVSTRVTAEAVGDRSAHNREIRLGAQLGYTTGPSRVFIRAGYVKQPGGDASLLTGPSLGLGLTSGRVQLDIARIFDSFSSGLGAPPTYISVRVGL